MTNDATAKAARTKIEPATTLCQGDVVTVPLRVLDVKASDHSYWGRHDIIAAEVTEAAGDLPAGLRLQLRRPHDGSNDLRSTERRERRVGRGNTTQRDLLAAQPTMTRDELLALADARGMDTGAKPTKAQLLKLLGE